MRPKPGFQKGEKRANVALLRAAGEQEVDSNPLGGDLVCQRDDWTPAVVGLRGSLSRKKKINLARMVTFTVPMDPLLLLACCTQEGSPAMAATGAIEFINTAGSGITYDTRGDCRTRKEIMLCSSVLL